MDDRIYNELRQYLIDQLDGIVDAAPVGFIVIDDNDSVLWSNRRGRELLAIVDEPVDFKALVHPHFIKSYSALWHTSPDSPRTVYLQLVTDSNTRYVELTGSRRDDGRLYAWLTDLSEARALRAQLQRQKQPARQFLHALNDSLTAGIGYSELVNMLVKDGTIITGEALANVRRYTDELMQELRRLEGLLADEKKAPTRLKSSRVTPVQRRHVLVVDDEPAVGQFLSELMRGRQHKVTTFTDGYSALEFFKSQEQNIDLVILDQTMPGITGIGVATEMLAVVPELPVILCTGDSQVIDDQRQGKLNIKHFVSKPIDINELVQIVTTIFEDD